MEALELLVRPAAEWFKPDLIVSQHGCDSHALGPLSHLQLSTHAYLAQARLAHELAHQLACGRWVAVATIGSAWCRAAGPSSGAELSGRALPSRIPETWRQQWAADAQQAELWPLPKEFLDVTTAWTAVPGQADISHGNRDRLHRLQALALHARGSSG